MGLMEQNKKDIEQITQNTTDFGVSLFFEAPGGITATVNGYYSDHSMTFDELGNPVTGKKTSVCVSEQPLLDQDYPTRTSKGLTSFQNHFVTVTYADGNEVKYKIEETQPDYTINLITLFLTNYAQD